MGVELYPSREEVSTGGIGANIGTGHLYFSGEGEEIVQEATLPAGIFTFKRRPSTVEDRFKRRYIAGMYTKPLVYCEDLQVYLAGISRAPAPVLAAAAAGTIGISNNIGYIAFRHKNGDLIVHEGDISNGSSTITLTATQQRQWTLPATAADVRVTDIVGYVSVDGALPKEVFEVPIGTTTVTEDTHTIALGNPPPVDSQGNLRNARGIPPYTRFVVKYHRRAWYGGDPLYPYRWWYSELDEFESVGPLNYVEHLENETIVGGGSAGDQMTSFGQTVSYAIQGWDESDFRVYRTSPSIGCISHFSIVNIDELLYFASEVGPYVYVPAAGFRPIAHHDLLTWWREEFEANPDGFNGSWAEDDRTGMIWKLCIVYSTAPLTRYLIGFYQGFDPTVGDGSALPQWAFDYRDREDSAMGRLRRPGSLRSDFYAGSVDGRVRKENYGANDDDDADTYQKKMILEPPHYLPKQQVGDDTDGCEFKEASVFLRSEDKDWLLEARAGDDTAYQATLPNWKQDVKASLETIGNKTRVARTSHHFRLAGVAGKGASFRVTIPKAKNIEYRGLALEWGDGRQTRPLI